MRRERERERERKEGEKEREGSKFCHKKKVVDGDEKLYKTTKTSTYAHGHKQGNPSTLNEKIKPVVWAIVVPDPSLLATTSFAAVS